MMANNLFEKLCEILSSVWGWVLIAALTVIDYLSGYGIMVKIAVLAVVTDAVWGIASSLKQGRFALSELGRNTLSKLSVYGCALISFIGVDRLAGLCDGLTTRTICIIIVLVEFWSTAASMLICFPDMPFLRLMKKALTGEISRKLDITPEEVEDALKK